jgi:hypothetical protein
LRIEDRPGLTGLEPPFAGRGRQTLWMMMMMMMYLQAGWTAGRRSQTALVPVPAMPFHDGPSEPATLTGHGSNDGGGARDDAVVLSDMRSRRSVARPGYTSGRWFPSDQQARGGPMAVIGRGCC